MAEKWKDKSTVVKGERYLSIYIEKRSQSTFGGRKVDYYKNIHIKKNRKSGFTVTKIRTMSVVDRQIRTKIYLKDLTVERMGDKREVHVSQTEFTHFKN